MTEELIRWRDGRAVKALLQGSPTQLTTDPQLRDGILETEKTEISNAIVSRVRLKPYPT